MKLSRLTFFALFLTSSAGIAFVILSCYWTSRESALYWRMLELNPRGHQTVAHQETLHHLIDQYMCLMTANQLVAPSTYMGVLFGVCIWAVLVVAFLQRAKLDVCNTELLASGLIRKETVKLLADTLTVGWPYLSFVYLYLSDPRMLQWYLDTGVIHLFFFVGVVSHFIGLAFFRRISKPAFRWLVYYFFCLPLYFSPLWGSIYLINPLWFVHM